MEILSFLLIFTCYLIQAESFGLPGGKTGCEMAGSELRLLCKPEEVVVANIHAGGRGTASKVHPGCRPNQDDCIGYVDIGMTDEFPLGRSYVQSCVWKNSECIFDIPRNKALSGIAESRGGTILCNSRVDYAYYEDFHCVKRAMIHDICSAMSHVKRSITGRTGFLVSPGFPGRHDLGVCTRNINVRDGYNLLIALEYMDVELEDDEVDKDTLCYQTHLNVTDAVTGQQVARFCDRTRFTIILELSRVTITYVAMDRHSNGFVLRFQEIRKTQVTTSKDAPRCSKATILSVNSIWTLISFLFLHSFLYKL